VKRLTIFCALCVLCVVSARAAEKLNVLLLMADDLRDFGGVGKGRAEATAECDQFKQLKATN
jgi:hypothetical protein